MKNSRHALFLGLPTLLGALASGCTAGARPTVASPTSLTVPPPTYLAQSAATSCQLGDSTMVCCIKKFPRTPVESCGATVAEAAEVLNGVKVLNEAVPTSENDAVPGEEVQEEEDDFANNAHLPEWKQRCIRTYNDCVNDGWTGNCYDCFRYCEGQQEWPARTCAPPKKR